MGIAHKYTKADVIKLCGLLAFFVLVAIICFFIWPYVSVLFEEGGVDKIIEDVRAAGAAGVLVVLGLQFLQIIVAFIPGEVVQIAAGVLYGPWGGALLILTGCILCSSLIYVLVHKLGAPFVQDMVPMKYAKKFDDFEKSGKLDAVVLVLFLIPGLPKDTFTYLVPLTNMPMKKYILLSNGGRIPGILLTTIAADSFMEGNITVAIVIFAIAAVLAVLGLIFKDRIMDFFAKSSKHSD